LGKERKSVKIQVYISQILDELRGTLAYVPNDQVEKLANATIGARRVFVAGAGRSGLAMKTFAMRLMHLGFDTYVVGETITPSITSSDLLLIGSGSGSTSSLVANANKAHAIGATIYLITIDKDSPIGQMADVVLAIPAPSPKIDKDLGFNSVQPMGSLFEQSLLLTLDAIILLLMDKTGKGTTAMFARHANLE
jgi:6-phospho-3-hexuloisomerase